MSGQRRSGTINFAVDGVTYDAKGNFSYNLGKEKREAIIGSDGVHGFKATQQVAFIEGEITDRLDLDLEKIVMATGATPVLSLGNGKVIVLRDAWFAGEGTGNSEEGNIAIRFESGNGEEIK